MSDDLVVFLREMANDLELRREFGVNPEVVVSRYSLTSTETSAVLSGSTERIRLSIGDLDEDRFPAPLIPVVVASDI